MKTIMIILFLIFAGIVNGQQIFTRRPYFKQESTLTVPITLQDLLDYQQECKNDSTEIPFDCYCVPLTEHLVEICHPNIINDRRHELVVKKICGNLNADISYYNVWIYTKPTFEGFIEYMKNKYKSPLKTNVLNLKDKR